MDFKGIQSKNFDFFQMKTTFIKQEIKELRYKFSKLCELLEKSNHDNFSKYTELFFQFIKCELFFSSIVLKKFSKSALIKMFPSNFFFLFCNNKNSNMPQQFTKEFQRKFSFKNMLMDVKYMFLNKKETTNAPIMIHGTVCNLRSTNN